MKKQVMRWKHMAMVVLVLAAGLMYLSSWLPEETGWEKLTSSDESVPTQNLVSDAGEKEEVWESSHSQDVGNRDQTVQMESLPWIFVHVAGAVHEPGVYQVETGTRVYQVIELAGGLTEEADQDFLNLAGSVEDGQKITVYTKAQVEAGETREVYRADSGSSVDEQEKKVNLNTADKETLMTLSGIGEARAEAILAYREEQGGFQSIEEIMEISGIKTAAFEKIKDQITV